MNNEKTYCGFIAIIGCPNVGKSTLLNRILGQKISITSYKPQTTRHRILGIKTQANIQTIYVDTPGLHRTGKNAINRYMNKAATRAVGDVDAVLFLVDSLRWTAEDEWILGKLKKITIPVILVVNKVDKIAGKEKLLPQLEMLSSKMNFADVIPISAAKGTNVEKLQEVVSKYLPESSFYYEQGQLTDKTDRFLAAEIIREKLTRLLGDELPYSVTVEIEQFKLEAGILRIAAVILVEKIGQKAIVIGAHGAQLKTIGTKARLDMEKLFGKKVFLHLWVKVKTGWSDDQRILKQLGYGD